MGSLPSSFIPAGRLRNSPLSPRALLCRIGPRRQGFASPIRALDGFGPIRKTRCLRGKGGDRAVGREGDLAHDKGYYHSCLGRSRKLAFGHRAGAGIARLPGPLSRGGVAGSGRAGRADLAWSVPGNPVKARQADCHCLLADTELLRKFRDGVLKIPIAFQIKNALEKKLFRH